MNKPDSIGEAQDIATKALTFLGAQKLAPIPNNYTVAYCYFSGGHNDLASAIEQLLATGGIAAEDMLKVYDTFFGLDAESQAIQSAGIAIEKVIANVKQAVGDAGAEAESYGRVLEDFTAQVVGGTAGGAGDVGQALAHILTETKKMEARNSELEEQFAKSSVEMNELRRNLSEMRLAAYTDSLTGVGNRKHFDQSLKKMIEECAVGDEPLALLMADIDHFKKFNDTYGHQVGDHVLRLVADAMTQCVRGRDFVARYGGEEFAVILPQTDLRGALAVAENVRATIASKRLTRKRSGESLGMITLSIGAALYRGDEVPDALVKRADDGLYKAKKGGRNRTATVEGGAPRLAKVTPLAG
ncbi:MAG: GGDEF domain-containing protein [Alphaproteobacteria bacterium]|nr:GGDEF domain-containing protein [Alphaproteobacteria bacterium]